MASPKLSIQFRSFGVLGGYQAEVKGKSASHGKAGYGIIYYYLNKLGANKLPKDQSQIKKRVLSNDENLYSEFITLWNRYQNTHLSNNSDILEISRNSKNPEDWLFSKYISLLILDCVESMTPESKDNFINNIAGYAKSESDFSSIFVKVY